MPKDETLKTCREKKKTTKNNRSVAAEILKITGAHPYYTQQLAFIVWENLVKGEDVSSITEKATLELVRTHDIDYERLWNTFNSTDRKIMIGMSISKYSPLSDSFSKKFNTGATSTIFSSLKRLMQKGYIVKTEKGYDIDDPFFKRWIVERRKG